MVYSVILCYLRNDKMSCLVTMQMLSKRIQSSFGEAADAEAVTRESPGIFRIPRDTTLERELSNAGSETPGLKSTGAYGVA